MGKEIERKFLVKGDAWKALAPGIRYRQGYLNSSFDRTVRVRTIGDQGFITVKGPNNGIARLEFEYVIPADDANEMLTELAEKPLIEKNRYRFFGESTSGKWMSFSETTRDSSSRRSSSEASMSRLRNRSGLERRSQAIPATTIQTSSPTRIPSGSKAAFHIEEPRKNAVPPGDLRTAMGEVAVLLFSAESIRVFCDTGNAKCDRGFLFTLIRA